MDKVIIITGGAGGIGSDICRGLAADGLKVVVADYAKDAAEKTAAEIRNAKGDATAVEVDVCSKESVAGARKRDEERVALRVDLVSAVSVERLAEQALMIGHDGAVGIAELLDEPRRALDVGEEERDRAGRGFHHGAKREPSGRRGRARRWFEDRPSAVSQGGCCRNR